MRAAIYRNAQVLLEERPTPSPRELEILVRVHASALNRADLLQRKGAYPAPAGWPPDIGGIEYAGVVEAVGRPGGQAVRWKVGDRVMGLVGGGGHAEYVVVHQDEALPVPDKLSWEEAAAIPEAFLTAWDALTTRGRLVRGERLLFHAAASGVGTAAVQIAKHLGATVVGTSRSAEKLVKLRALGLDEGIDTSVRGFREQLSAPVDVIIDPLGAPAFAHNLDALNPLGRLVLLGFLQGSKASEVELGHILRKRLTVVGTVMRARAPEERRAIAGEYREHLHQGFVQGRFRPVVGASYPMERIAEAHAAMEKNETFGKVVLIW
jgi:NADPH2:quinone reductase